MSHLIEIAFKGNRKEFFLWEADDLPSLKAAVIVEADRGEDLGRVHATGELAAKRSAGVPHGLGAEGAAPARRALRLATPDDVKRAAELAEQNESARRRAMERVKANNLVMKLTDAEWQWDRKKLTFYFTAEKRVDFRNLVRDLASMFRTRIELKQIGVRDEARRLDGIGRCGRQYCSSSWLPELRPVNLGVAKDQRLSLNPTQISGACGRLMCSLRYEHEFYVQSRKRFPKEGKILVTSLGEEKVVANDIFHDRVTLRRPDGDARVVALADLKREVAAAAEAAGDPAAIAAAAASVTQGAGDDAEAPADTTGHDLAEETELTSADAGRDALGERRHEPRPDARRPRGQEQRRPPRDDGSDRASSDAAGASEANGADGAAAAVGRASESRPASGSPEGSTPAIGAGAWLRHRAPLPQLSDPRGGATRPAAAATPAATQPPAVPVAAATNVEPARGVPGSGDDEAGSAAPTAAVVPSSSEEESAAEQQQRRARRRRGRRGGRRGRGGAGGTVGPNDRPSDAASVDEGGGDDEGADDAGGATDRATDGQE